MPNAFHASTQLTLKNNVRSVQQLSPRRDNLRRSVPATLCDWRCELSHTYVLSALLGLDF